MSADFTFKKKDAVVPLGSKSYAKIDGQSLPIDPQLLFQRLLTAAQEGSENLADIFKYELCNRPPALFDPSGLPREAKKSALADAIWSVGKRIDMHCTTTYTGDELCARWWITVVSTAMAKRYNI